jgi:dolichol-phosphate mannosyltransferase
MLSIVMPVHNEAANIERVLAALAKAVHVPAEVLIVYDDETDSTLPVARSCVPPPATEYRLVCNTLGRGPANALKSGFAAARGESVLVTMADLSDDLPALDRMLARLADGYDLVAGSRYVQGGKQLGGPWVKGKLSRLAGISLHTIGLPTHDPTNSFKLYRTERLRELSLTSTHGFEINLEIVAKAWRAGWRITEVPATWIDRVAGRSNFKFWRWLPRYLRWYAYAVAIGVSRGLAPDAMARATR